jgi:hypothetical protein
MHPFRIRLCGTHQKHTRLHKLSTRRTTFKGNNSVCFYRLLNVHNCQIQISYVTIGMQNEFNVGDRVAVGENGKL